MRFDDARGWRSVPLGAIGILGVALVTFASFWLQAENTAAALLYLLVILLVSLSALAAPAFVVGVVAIVCLDYFFTPPLFEARMITSHRPDRSPFLLPVCAIDGQHVIHALATSAARAHAH